MKPDWKDAPEWANFLSGDTEFGWVWHEVEPTVEESPASRKFVWTSPGKSQSTKNEPPYILESRP